MTLLAAGLDFGDPVLYGVAAPVVLGLVVLNRILIWLDARNRNLAKQRDEAESKADTERAGRLAAEQKAHTLQLENDRLRDEIGRSRHGQS